LSKFDLSNFVVWMSEKQDKLREKEGVLDLDFFNELVVDEIKRRVRHACEFYLKYFDSPDDLVDDFPEFLDELRNVLGVEPPFYEHYYSSKYNEWLFKLAFKSVLEGDE